MFPTGILLKYVFVLGFFSLFLYKYIYIGDDDRWAHKASRGQRSTPSEPFHVERRTNVSSTTVRVVSFVQSAAVVDAVRDRRRRRWWKVVESGDECHADQQQRRW